MRPDRSLEEGNKTLVRASCERWANGAGNPFDPLLPEAEWTIVGSSPLSKTYRPIQKFLDEVIHPFNAHAYADDSDGEGYLCR